MNIKASQQERITLSSVATSGDSSTFSLEESKEEPFD
jgi:hypothetical protein